MLSSAYHEIVHGTGENPVRAFMNEQTYPFPHHWHEEIELIYSVGEGTTVLIEDRQYVMNQRDVLIVWPGDVHSFNYSLKGSTYIVIQFSLSLLGKSYSLFSKHVPKSALITPENMVHNLLETHLLNIWQEFCDNRPDYLMAVTGEIYLFMLTLLRGIEWVPFSKSEADKRRQRFERLRNVFTFITEHYHQEIGLNDAAEAAAFSVYHFTRFFRDATGLTFWQYLNRYRIGRAQEQLTESDKTITEIAYNVGFSSVKTFNRVFKDIVGCPPSQYRKE